MRALLVEDEHLLGIGLQEGLRQYRYTVDWVQDGHAAIESLTRMTTDSFDVIILDLGLPKISGVEVLRTIREKKIDIPVLVLTARDAVEHKVEGLDLGADDYLTKPFNLEELAARLRALQRRNRARSEPTIRYGDITVDPASHIITYKNDTVLVSRREFSLLQKLLENEGRVITRDQLNQTLYGWGENIDSNALEVHIHNLRKRFGSNLIRTIRGIGYMVDKAKQEA